MSAGKKAGRVLKRTTNLLITTHWTVDHGTTPSFSPAVAPLSVQQGQHSLLDAESILAQDIPNLRTAAALEQSDDFTSEALPPASPPVTG